MSVRKALVLFSGGQDSTTSLCWAKENFDQVQAMTFDYGQIHHVELSCAKSICEILHIEQNIVDLTFLAGFSDNALTKPSVEISMKGTHGDLPSTFVPGRNALFLTVAGAYASAKGMDHLVIGASQVDYSGYPDCREEFLRSQEKTLSLACDQNILIYHPLLHLSKAQTFHMAKELGALDLVIEHSHTCYRGDREHLHVWGYGCGQCPACELREKGFQEYQNQYSSIERENTHGDS
ncbi:MAG: 7-cyano-7-deazaguanine synthase QueC [Bdellovibrionales bacterium]|nr:7-cyano-7-deazaguanine synthase QueC [Bdellovibrionales bacterium]